MARCHIGGRGLEQGEPLTEEPSSKTEEPSSKTEEPNSKKDEPHQLKRSRGRCFARKCWCCIREEILAIIPNVRQELAVALFRLFLRELFVAMLECVVDGFAGEWCVIVLLCCLMLLCGGSVGGVSSHLQQESNSMPARGQTPRQAASNKITDNKEICRLQQESNSMLARSQTPRQTYRPGPRKAVSRFFAAGVELHAGKEPNSAPSTKQQTTRKFIVCSRSQAPCRQVVKLSNSTPSSRQQTTRK